MPREALSASIAALPRETKMNGAYTRTAVRMDGALIVYAWLDASFAKPADSPPDQHPFDQVVQVISGRLRMVVGDVEHALAPGDVLYIPADVPHDGGPIDGPAHFMEIFAPVREDYGHLAAHQAPGDSAGARA